MFWNETATHRSTHIANDTVVDTTTVTEYKTPNTDTFKFSVDPAKPGSDGSAIVNISGDSSNPKPSWGMTIS